MPDADPLWTETCSMWSPITTPKYVVVCGGQVLCLTDTTKHNGINHIKFLVTLINYVLPLKSI